jgi:hypothetical protein
MLVLLCLAGVVRVVPAVLIPCSISIQVGNLIAAGGPPLVSKKMASKSIIIMSHDPR